MSTITECPRSRNVHNHEMSTIMECPRSRNVHNYGMSQITECPQSWNVPDQEMSTIMECPRSQNVHNHGMSQITECPQSWNVPDHILNSRSENVQITKLIRSCRTFFLCFLWKLKRVRNFNLVFYKVFLNIKFCYCIHFWGSEN